MLTPETIRRTECLGDPYAMKSCADIDRKGAAEELYKAVRAACEAEDQSIQVHFCEQTWNVYVEGMRVESLSEIRAFTAPGRSWVEIRTPHAATQQEASE